MAKDRVMTTTVSEAVHKIQLALLDGIKDDNHLFAAGSLMCRSDYNDVVTERSISGHCGYPLCPNSLPPEPPKKGHYRVSLKEHKVYDLNETYMYCGSGCLISSRAFAGSLQEERCSTLNVAKVNEILSLFENVEGEGEDEEEARAKLVIKEKEGVRGGEVRGEEWMGETNAIEGYVPKRDRRSKNVKEGLELGKAKSSKQKDVFQNEVDFKVAVMPYEEVAGSSEGYKKDKSSKHGHPRKVEPEVNFTSTIIINNEFAVPKKSDRTPKPVHSGAKDASKPKGSGSKNGNDSVFGIMDFMSTIIAEDEYSVSKLPPNQLISDPDQVAQDFSKKLGLGDAQNQFEMLVSPKSSMASTINGTGSTITENASFTKDHFSPSQNDASSSARHVEDESHTEREVHSSKTTAKSSLRTSGERKAVHSVTWADEKLNGVAGGNLCEFQEFRNTNEGSHTSGSKGLEDNEDSQRFVSAEACAMALSQAAEAVASGKSDATDAVSEAGIVVLPQSDAAVEKDQPLEIDVMEETDTVKWPKKPDNLKSDDDFDSDKSWFDAPPDGFSLTLSHFAMMWNTLFSWMTSSSLAYIYGRDNSFHEEYMSINGREYPSKVVLPDGRSPEIKQTLAGCLARALPGLVADLKLPTPISTLEQGLGYLLDTLSFMDALPPFRMKQWQVIVLLFIDALSVCRIPTLTPHLTSRRILIPKVLNGAQISSEEYEILKDLVIPLGRVPQFSMQSGG